MKQKMLWTINNIEQVITSIALAGMILLLSIQVMSRFIFNNSVPWTEELSRYAFFWLVFVAVSLVAKENAHIRIIDHLKILPDKLARIVLVIADTLWLAFNIIVIIEGTKMFIDMEQFPLISATLQWDLKYVIMIIPISFFLASIRIIENNIKTFKNKDELSFNQTNAD